MIELHRPAPHRELLFGALRVCRHHPHCGVGVHVVAGEIPRLFRRRSEALFQPVSAGERHTFQLGPIAGHGLQQCRGRPTSGGVFSIVEQPRRPSTRKTYFARHATTTFLRRNVLAWKTARRMLNVSDYLGQHRKGHAFIMWNKREENGADRPQTEAAPRQQSPHRLRPRPPPAPPRSSAPRCR